MSKMQVIIAENSGFCYGVRRAVDMALEEVRKGPVATYGPLIHNPQMIEELERQGVRCKSSIDDFHFCDRMIIRSHGVGPDIYEIAKQKSLQIIDATCPNVRMAQKKAQKAVADGFLPIIIGEKDHPEVKSLKKWTQPKGFVVQYTSDIDKIPKTDRYAVIVQTTFERAKFNYLLAEIMKMRPGEYRVERTICAATMQRQNAAVELAGRVDAMIVIGGHNSANTKHLTELVKSYCAKVVQVETATEIDTKEFLQCHKVGITAGASTPDRLIKEAYILMENMENRESFEKMLEESMEGVMIYPGKIVDAEVIQKDKEGVYVAFHYMREGFIPYSEWSVAETPENLFETIKIGDKVEAKIVLNNNKDEFIRMSKIKAEREAAWKTVAPLAEGEKRQAVVEVLRVIKNKMKNIVGLSVMVEGVEGFMPASHVELKRVENFESYVGQKLQAEIIEVDLEKHRIVVSRREMLKAEKEEKARLFKEQREARIIAAREARAAAAEAALETIEEGAIVTGKVVKIADFGLFVEIAKGLSGLVHTTELGWEHGLKPQEAANIGDEIQVLIKKVDRENKHVALSIKATVDDPWKIDARQFNVGDIVTGKVVKFLGFGAIVRLTDKVEALVHVSEISNDRVEKPEDVLKIGQQVKAVVLRVDMEARKVGLSIAQVSGDKDDTKYDSYMSSSDTLTVGLADKFDK